MTNEPIPAAPVAERVRREMSDEAHALIEAARAEGITLRLLGGLGVREHCRSAQLCARDYSDLDMAAPASEARRLPRLLERFGYHENLDVATSTGVGQLQFVRPCRHGAEQAGAAHADDHIDVFLDTFHMDHDIALKRRLELEPVSLSLADLLLTKLQIFALNDKDIRDIVTLLDGAEVSDDGEAGTIDARYIAGLCADDWGLFYDVVRNLQRVDERVGRLGLTDSGLARVRRGLLRLIAAIDTTPRSLRFRLRARVGTRARWHSHLDDQD
jgi:hypothetical protein